MDSGRLLKLDEFSELSEIKQAIGKSDIVIDIASRLNQIEDEDLRLDNRRVLGLIDLNQSSNGHKPTNRSVASWDQENVAPVQQRNTAREVDAIEQARRESVDIKINPFMMHRQIHKLQVPFRSALPRFKSLA